jgi:hypothetical protein
MRSCHCSGDFGSDAGDRLIQEFALNLEMLALQLFVFSNSAKACGR